MNRISPKTGGYPAYIPTDYIFLQAAFAEAIQGLSLLFGSSFIVQGTDLDFVNGRVNSGWIVYKGEVMRVDQVTGDDFTAFLAISDKVYVPVEIVDPGIGSVTYADGNPKASHMIRRAKVVSLATVEGLDYVDYNQVKLTRQEANFTSSLGLFGPDISPVGTFVGYVRELNSIRLSGLLTISAAVSKTPPVHLFTLPEGNRPQGDLLFPIAGVFSSGASIVQLRINSAGSVNPGRVELLGGFQTGDRITLDGIQFRLT
jgi:hypothetical protein